MALQRLLRLTSSLYPLLVVQVTWVCSRLDAPIPPVVSLTLYPLSTDGSGRGSSDHRTDSCSERPETREETSLLQSDTEERRKVLGSKVGQERCRDQGGTNHRSKPKRYNKRGGGRHTLKNRGLSWKESPL